VERPGTALRITDPHIPIPSAFEPCFARVRKSKRGCRTRSSEKRQLFGNFTVADGLCRARSKLFAENMRTITQPQSEEKKRYGRTWDVDRIYGIKRSTLYALLNDGVIPQRSRETEGREVRPSFVRLGVGRNIFCAPTPSKQRKPPRDARRKLRSTPSR
jgi:predicted DNA-binding transcriptional regulator AlpA